MAVSVRRRTRKVTETGFNWK